MDFRIDILCKMRGLNREQARKFIENHESRRAQYYAYYTGKKWGAAESYDLCIDASVLGIEDTEKIIADFIRKRFGL
jgi:cytidylate kinase